MPMGGVYPSRLRCSYVQTCGRFNVFSTYPLYFLHPIYFLAPRGPLNSIAINALRPLFIVTALYPLTLLSPRLARGRRETPSGPSSFRYFITSFLHYFLLSTPISPLPPWAH